MQRESILRDQRNFVSVYNRGNSKGSKYVVVLYKKNRLGMNRVAFVASKKVGNSVKRNRARRLMKEAFRNVSDKLVSGYDIIFVARNGIDEVKMNDVQRSMYNALNRASLLE